MMHKTTGFLMTMALAALTLNMLGCDPAGDLAGPTAERAIDPDLDVAMLEGSALAIEAREAQLDVTSHVCDQAEEADLVEACVRRELQASALDLTFTPVEPEPTSATPWSCVESNACGGQTEWCFCDWACVLFGDCCPDYNDC